MRLWWCVADLESLSLLARVLAFIAQLFRIGEITSDERALLKELALGTSFRAVLGATLSTRRDVSCVPVCMSVCVAAPSPDGNEFLEGAMEVLALDHNVSECTHTFRRVVYAHSEQQ